VAQSALRESNEYSNENDKENDALTMALRTKEQRGRIRGVSRKLIWKDDFLEHKPTYRKWKMTSTPWVDIEEMKNS
jgi:hypothetical protein